jgi:hypothetical protein
MALSSIERVSIVTQKGKAPELVIKTPGGDITVKSVGDTDYPDASIFVGEQCIGFLEWHPDSQQFNFHYYGMSEDEPEASFENVTNI